MCRLFALTDNQQLTPPQHYIFNVMAIHSSRLNNRHGTGIVVKSGAKLYYNKSGLGAEDFVISEAWLKTQRKPHEQAFGHARLASSTWRVQWNQEYPTEHAHPFKVGSISLLMHNGAFAEHRRIATELKLGKVEEVTDTMAFAALLQSISGEDKFPTPTDIIAALDQAGKCEYAMIITSAVNAPILVRGTKELHIAQTNYGLLVNTTKANLNDTIKDTALCLVSMGHEPVKLLSEIQLLDEWSIWTINGAEVTKQGHIPEEVREKNKPPVKPTTTSTSYYQAGSLPGAYDSSAAADWGAIEQTALEMFKLKEILPELVTSAEIEHMLTNAHGLDRTNWWQFSAKEIETLRLILQWAFAKKADVCKPTTRKDELWLKFLIEEEYDLDDLSLSPYATAVDRVPQFTIPYFLNTEPELEALSA